MSTPDDFESEAGDAGATSGPKHYQVVVPNFTFPGASPPPTGSSFVRLGSFPDVNNATDGPAGFQNSLALANLVGKASDIQSAEKGIDTIPKLSSDGSGLASPYGSEGDSNYLLGFADDTRKRGTDPAFNPTNTLSNGQPVPNTNATRQEETRRLLTKGGWWDHSDGNRVTTTSGDKIEIIQGNYKLVVLGRQPLDTNITKLVGNAFITDVSGGHFQEQYPSPTPCIKTVEYSQDGATGEWTLYQDNGLGNLITKLAGRTVDMFQGTKRETYVGSDPGSGPSLIKGPDALDPEIISKTWAKKIETYTGALNKPVPRVAAFTWAQRVETYTFAESIDSVTTAINTFELTVGLKESVQVGNQISIFMGATESLYVGAKAELCAGPSISLGTSSLNIFAAKEIMNVQKSEINVAFQRIGVAATALAVTSTAIENEAVSLHVGHIRLAMNTTSLAAAINLGV